MINFLKVLTGSALLIGGVFTLAVLFVVGGVLLSPSGKQEASVPESYLNISYFETDKENSSKSNVVEEKSLYCNGSECQDLVAKLDSECLDTKSPKVIVEGYLNGKYINKKISSNCAGFKEVKESLA
jgi:hypothetical protein